MPLLMYIQIIMIISVKRILIAMDAISSCKYFIYILLSQYITYVRHFKVV